MITTESNPTITEMSSIILKNKLIRQEEAWLNISEEIKGQIKQALFSLLASAEETKVKSVSLTSAAIAAVEVPKQKWPEFLQSMNNAMQSKDYQFSAMQTI